MKRWFRSRWLWLLLFLAVMTVSGVLHLRRSVSNVMHPALDQLSAVSLAERWSHPELHKIRELGVKAVPSLRRVLREQNSPTIRLLLWVKAKWPGATKYLSHFPDENRLSERCWVACQVLTTLGPAGKTAAPELVEILKGNDLRNLNAATMALHAIGIDAEICDRLTALMEQEEGMSAPVRSYIVSMLGSTKPPSARTLTVLAAALSDPSPYVQSRAAETLGRLGTRTPVNVAALKQLQSTSTNELVVVKASVALWELEKDAGLVLPPVFQVLENRLDQPLEGWPGGETVTAGDQVFMAAGNLFERMTLTEPERAKALALLDSWCKNANRILNRMVLLPSMMELGFPTEKCLEVCTTGLNQQEDYYRIRAAKLLTVVSRKHSVNELDLDALMHDREVGVRVYAAEIHWLKNRRANVVVPILIESLDRSRHGSYHFAEIQPAALAVLGDIGPEAQEAVEPLEKLLRDPNPTIVKLVSEALDKIRKPGQ